MSLFGIFDILHFFKKNRAPRERPPFGVWHFLFHQGFLFLVISIFQGGKAFSQALEVPILFGTMRFMRSFSRTDPKHFEETLLFFGFKRLKLLGADNEMPFIRDFS